MYIYFLGGINLGNIRELKKLIALSGHNWICIVMGLSAILRTVRDLACLISISYAMDQLLIGGNTTFAFLLVVIFEISGAPILAFDAYICQKYRLEKEKSIISLLADKLQSVNLTWIENENSADLLSTCTADLQKFLNWLTDVFPNFIRTVSYLIGGLIYALTQDVVLTLCVFPIVIKVVPILASATKPLRKMSDAGRTAAGSALEKAQEILVNPEFVKAYTLELVMKNRVSEALVTRYKAECKSGITLSFAKGLGKLMSVVPSIIAAGVGFLFLENGAITVGFLFGFVQMASQRFGFVIPQIGDILALTTQAASSAIRINAIISAETEEEKLVCSPDKNCEYTWNLTIFLLSICPDNRF